MATNPEGGVESSRYKGWSHLHRAAAKNYFPRVKKLISTTPESIEATNPQGMTPLQVAAQHGSLESFLVLFKSGADAGVLTEEGLTVVQLAVQAGQVQFTVALVNEPPFTHTNILTQVCQYIQEFKGTRNTFAEVVLILDSLLCSMLHKPFEEYYNAIKTLEELEIVSVFESILKQSIQEKLVSAATCTSKCLLIIIPHFTKAINKSRIPKLLITLTEVISDHKACYQALSTIAELIEHAPDSYSVVSALGGPLVLLKILQTHKSHELHIVAMKCIAQGGANPQLAQQFASPEMIAEFMNALNMEQSGTSVLAATVTALHSLIQSSYEVRYKFIDEGLVEKLLDLTKPFDKKLTEPCITLLWMLCDSNHKKVEEQIKKHQTAISILMFLTEHGMNMQLQHMSLEVLWYTAGESIHERRALATVLGPSCLVTLAELGSPKIALTALELLSPVAYNKQSEVIKAGGILLLVTVLRSSSDNNMKILALKTLENLSYGMGLMPNREAQAALKRVDGIQLLIQIFQYYNNEEVRVQAFCTLATYSNKCPDTKKLIFEMISLGTLLQPLQTQPHTTPINYTQGICYLAFNNIPTQSKMVALGGILIDSFLYIISTGNNLQVMEAAFQMIVLARVFTNSKQSIITAFGLKILIKSLKSSIKTEDIDLQVKTGLYISGLLRMRAGLAGGLVGLGLIPLLVSLLLGKHEGARTAGAVCMTQLTHDPSSSRQLLCWFRLDNKLCFRMQQYSTGHQPSSNFIDTWKAFCRMHNIQKRQ